MPSLGPMEILVILVVALVVLGPTRLPEAGRQVGRAMTEFRRWSTGVQTELRSVLDDTTPPTIEPKQVPPADGDQPADPPGDTTATTT
jgi:sec-independent protein translocase protein TatA